MSNRSFISFVFVAVILACSGLTEAGDLNPSSPPGPTMKTLDEVEPRIPINELPVVIKEPGSYYVTGNLSSTDEHAITITTDDVTIDLMGHTLSGPDTGLGNGIYTANHSNIDIRNGSLRDFYQGIWLNGAECKDCRITNIRVSSNTSSGLLIYGSGAVITRCVSSYNAANGITAVGDATIVESVVNNNEGSGILAGDGSSVSGNRSYDNQSSATTGGGIVAGRNCTIKNNTSFGNLSNGIYASDGCTVSGNTANKNSRNGISAGACSVMTDNTAYDNEIDGIVGNGSNCQINNSTARANGRNGINTSSACSVRSCTATGNTAHGIQAGLSSKVIDNLASYNLNYGIRVYDNCTVTGNTAGNNVQWGIFGEDACMIRDNHVTTNNTVGSSSYGGIHGDTSCLIRDNMCFANKNMNIYTSSYGNLIEGNLVTNKSTNSQDTTKAIYMAFNGNYCVGNRVYNSTDPFDGISYNNNASVTTGSNYEYTFFTP